MGQKGILICKDLPAGCAECPFEGEIMGRRSCLLYAKMRMKVKWIHAYDLQKRPDWCLWKQCNGVEGEDKKLICDILACALLATRQFSDIETLSFSREENGEEIVSVQFRNGGKRRINVTMDSGWSMIQDIVNNIAG